MNPLFVMFMTEARDLLEEISKGLLDLETKPGDIPTMNGIFRALHTLKGSSGLFEPDLDSVRRVAHAGEDLLDAVRNGRLAFTSEMADPLLDSLDAVGHWLEEMNDHGAVSAEADADSHAMAAILRNFLHQKATDNATQESDAKVAPKAYLPAPSWLTRLPERLQTLIQTRGEETLDTLVAVYYTPDPQCFFTGDDPFYLIRQIPQLVAFHVETSTPWPPADQLDPFVCAVRFLVVTETPREEIAKLFRYVEEQTEITLFNPVAPAMHPEPVAKPVTAKPVAGEEAMVLRIVQAQQEILTLPCPPAEWEYRLLPMEQLLRALFTRRNLPQLLEALHPVMAEVRATLSFAPLRTLLASLIQDFSGSEASPSPVVAPSPGAKGVAGSRERESDADSPAEAAVYKRRAEDTSQKDKTLRIDQNRIDQLLDLVGELVVAKNSVPFLAQRADRHYGVKPLAREILEFFGVINRLTDELQSSIMQVRLMPVSTIFDRFPRLVRDISRKLDKKINLEMEGGTTAADKNIVEMLSDPLIHLVRNSLDHGIELPAVRVAAGKDPHGEIKLIACQQSDRVVIEIHDNGKGIDPEIIKKKAYEKGIITEDQLESLSDHEAIQLIFVAGFSTAEQISDLSGRGVGMDVVRSAVEHVGGSVVVFSTLGEGSRVRLELPMTMAISRVMLIEQSDSLFGVPLSMVAETVRIPRSVVQTIKDREVIVLRGKILPLVRLRERLQLGPEPVDSTQRELAVLVVNPAGEEIGLVVDNFQKGVDIVIKPLEGILSALSVYSGGALLGDGRVLLVLNLKELI
ncbi:MAG: chemotaxis protein CheA [Magnetococcus sp. YQC-5]